MGLSSLVQSGRNIEMIVKLEGDLLSVCFWGWQFVGIHRLAAARYYSYTLLPPPPAP